MRYGFLFALFKRSHDHLRGFLIAAWAGDKIAEFSFPEILFHFPLRPWFFFVSPAYAGKRRSGTASRTSRRDHPRACGEKKRTVADNVAPQGSPPRMRGKERYFVWQEDGTGITPAHAGKSREVLINVPGSGDHPRVCGEKKGGLRYGHV